MHILGKIYKTFCKIETAICGIGFFSLVMLVFISAILRMFRISMTWNMDLAMLLLAWTAFLGADIAYRSGQLVGINLVTRKLPMKMQKIVQILVSIAVLIVLGIVIVFGIRLANFESLRRFQSIPIPFSVLTMSLVIPSMSMVITSIIKIKNCILSFNKNTEELNA
jgi:TRAP-type C4-dicarboxylate transport system permease small subunit